MADALTPYGELADVIDALPLLLRETRRARGLSLRAAAEQSGVDFNTLGRIERGQDCMMSNAVAVVRWLGTPPKKTVDPQAAVSRIRELHPRDDSNPRGPWCGTCLTVWPCPTAQAIGEEP